jgi:hypothetical protein
MKHAAMWVGMALAGAILLGFTLARADDTAPPGRFSLKALADSQARQVNSAQTEAQARQIENGQVEKPQAQKPKAPKEETRFIRLKKNKDGEPTALQTAIVRYVPANGKSGLEVDLVGVVHIADRHYYNQLNDRFENYDVVLYELVAPKGFRVPKGGRSDNPLAILQKAMTLVLGLDLQTNCIDYTCTNFVHADLSFDEMAEAVKKRGDTPLTLALSIAADVLREQNLRAMKQGGRGNQPDGDPFELFFDPKGPAKLKMMMAEQLSEAGNGAGLGKTLDTILIEDRNSAAIKVFQKQLTAGKKKIAIFYGAAHMPNFERRLVEDFGLRRQSVEWFTAWDLRPRALDPLDLLQKLAR